MTLKDVIDRADKLDMTDRIIEIVQSEQIKISGSDWAELFELAILKMEQGRFNGALNLICICLIANPKKGFRQLKKKEFSDTQDTLTKNVCFLICHENY